MNSPCDSGSNEGYHHYGPLQNHLVPATVEISPPFPNSDSPWDPSVVLDLHAIETELAGWVGRRRCCVVLSLLPLWAGRSDGLPATLLEAGRRVDVIVNDAVKVLKAEAVLATKRRLSHAKR